MIRKLDRRISQLHLKDLKKGTACPNYGKLEKDAFDEIGDGMIPMKPIMRAAQKAGVKHCHVEQDHSPCPFAEHREEPASFEFMIWKTVFILGILLGLSVHAKSKAYLLIVSDDLKADALGCYGKRNLPKLPRRPTGPGRHALWKRLLSRDGLPSFPGKFHARTLPREKEIALGANIFKKTVIQVPEWARSFTCAYRETSSQEPMATATYRHVGRPNTTCLEKRLTPRETTLA